MAQIPIYPGQDVKFQVTTEWEDFHLTENNFTITIKNRWGQVKYEIKKDDCFWDSDGRYYFTIENVRQGVYFACFAGSFEDDDYDKQEAVVTDEQKILVVPSCVRVVEQESSNLVDGCQCCHKVHYQIVTTVSIDGDDYLCGSDGKYILTSDGKRICFKSDKAKEIEEMGKVRLDTMTGDEFKQFIEGRNPDKRIDTVPEMLDALRGISDDETVQEDVQEQISEQAGTTYDDDTRTLYINGAKPKTEEER